MIGRRETRSRAVKPPVGARIFYYHGGSMRPSLKTLDRLAVVPAAPKQITIGDILVFRCPGMAGNTVHRVIEAQNGWYRTQGDNNPKPDRNWIHLDQVVGKVVAVDRHGAWVAPPKRGEQKRSSHGSFRRLLGKTSKTMLAPFRPGLTHMVNAFGRITRYQKPVSEEYRLTMLGRTLATCTSEESNWRIRSPFSPFINEINLSPPRSRIAGISAESQSGVCA